jgi:cell wall-associated NlpC family hydrolase
MRFSSAKWLLFLFCFWLINVYAANQIARINQPVTNIYAKPSFDSLVVSQQVYGERVFLLDKNFGGWYLIESDDQYRGWIKSDYLSFKNSVQNSARVKVKNLFANLYRTPQTDFREPILMVPFDVEFELAKVVDERWIEVYLVDGSLAYIQQGDVEIDPKNLDMKQMLELSQKFLGLSYRWAGTSTFGFDCSGLIQMLYRQMGVILPRDTLLQANWIAMKTIAKNDLLPGDLVFFGWEQKISHVGLYLGKQKFLNVTPHSAPIVQISDLRESHWKDIFLAARRLDLTMVNVKFESSIDLISDNIKKQMENSSWHLGCPVAINDLRLVKVSYWGFDSQVHQGSLIVHKKVAEEIVKIFSELFQNKFPIDKMNLIDFYHGDDDASVLDNNTSAFNCRAMTDFPDRYSVHSYGLAIDLNPLLNPYVNDGKVSSEKARSNLPRDAEPGKINPESFVVDIFAKYGWSWGGNWKGPIKDYQHFEKL